jgi:hypothetical protein
MLFEFGVRGLRLFDSTTLTVNNYILVIGCLMPVLLWTEGRRIAQKHLVRLPDLSKTVSSSSFTLIKPGSE